MKTLILTLFCLRLFSQTVLRTQQDRNGDTMSVKDFGAKGDTHIGAGGAMTRGANVFCSSTATFTTANTGNPIRVFGAGPAGIPLDTTIVSIANATCANLLANADTTVGGQFGAPYFYGGADDTAAIESALAWACHSYNSRSLFFPQGTYKHTAQLSCLELDENFPVNGVAIYGSGAGSVLVNAGRANGGLYVSNSEDVFQETALTVHDLHFVNLNTGIAPFALDLVNQHGMTIYNITVDGNHQLQEGIRLEGSEAGTIENLNARDLLTGYRLTTKMLTTSGKEGVEAIAIEGGYIHCNSDLLSTTIAAGISSGTRTVTPASMVGISVGDVLTVSDAVPAHGEFVTVTKTTGSTFTAVFATPKTGSRIIAAKPGGTAFQLESVGTVRIGHVHTSGCAAGVNIAPLDATSLPGGVLNLDIDNTFLENTALGGIVASHVPLRKGGGKVVIANNAFYNAGGGPFALDINGQGFDIHDNMLVGSKCVVQFGPNIFDVKFTDNQLYGKVCGTGVTGISITIAASVKAHGSQTIKPASMAGIYVGRVLTVSNAGGDNSQQVTVTAVTSATFDAYVFLPLTGPGILLSSPVTPSFHQSRNYDMQSPGSASQALPDIRSCGRTP